MEEQRDKKQRQSRVKRGSNTFSYVAIAGIVVCIIIFYFYLQQRSSTSPIDQLDSSPTVHQENPQSPNLATVKTNETAEGLPSSNGSAPKNKPPAHPVNSLTQKGKTNADNQAQAETKELSDQSRQRLSPESNQQDLIDEINLFYTHLDQQPYMQGFGLKESSKIHFSKLLQKLVDNPPVVIRETDDLFTLLQNTAHFFRILGKDNINMLKGILSNEKNSFEKILEVFYSLTYQPEYLKKEYSLSIPPDALTDYAAFFLNTMGGRLYLFRRDSTSRMVVSYYAIITIDRANIEGNGGHGIDLRPAILSLVEEIENGGRRLQLREKYLDTLYDLQEKYN